MKRYLPMLAFASEPFDSPDYLYEIKYDGTRAVAYITKGKNPSRQSASGIVMINRRDNRIEGRYPEFRGIAELLNAKRGAVLDGEVVAFNKSGRPDFALLQSREHAADPFKISILSRQTPATYVVFDILEKDGRDLTKLPLSERKRILGETVRESGFLMVADYIEGRGKALFRQAKKERFEGIMAKRIDSQYVQERSRFWLKMKAVRSLDCVVIGYTEGRGWRKRYFGALVLGAYHGGKLVYVGKAGSGLSEEMLADILATLKKEETDMPPPLLDKGAVEELEGEGVRWVKTSPGLVCEAEYLLITKTLKLRAPVFLRLRSDKSPKDCTI